MKELHDLIEISQRYGKDCRYVIAGGGNTSFKNHDTLWVKASGFALATISEDGFAALDRGKLGLIAEKNYAANAAQREEEVKNDLAAACLTKDRRPSVETSMHNALAAAFVVHLHPTLVNALMCSQQAEAGTQKIFGSRALYIPYIDPGYTLFKEVDNRIKAYRQQHGSEPEIILLQNHGIFVGADSTAQVAKIYDEVMAKLSATRELPTLPVPPAMKLSAVVPALRSMLSGQGLKALRVVSNELVSHFASSQESFEQVARPFTPDIIVYCKSRYIYVAEDSVDATLAAAKREIDSYIQRNGYAPKVMLIRGVGLVAVGDSAASCDIIADVFADMMQLAYHAQAFGGGHPMTQEQVDFIDHWEVESYRRQVSSAQAAGGARVANKTIVVTGAAQGFGEGIARCLIAEGANIVVADLNEAVGQQTVQRFNAAAKTNRAIFVKTNVADTDSIDSLIEQTVQAFGGIDVLVSNAGILRAGGLEDMTPESFELVTKINYSAFFYCTRAASRVMKLQNRYCDTLYGDIIQINSKSGLRGSKANFAYAGGKFGGLGLTQSFALELAPFRIKVNAICPGNFYEGPLWSNPDNGLFVQYLKAGKVPNATTIDDVRRYYVAQVPMSKGTSPDDVTKALLYAIEQTCETGQAIPVTGGQVMLS
jgi:rhamnose utilization protein RhaD (predicted bifunctional aldolase and dehydrogenase)/NAD(P)-dependent dehydrogenase (short-subunit alcohol dehydrogenase family)